VPLVIPSGFAQINVVHALAGSTQTAECTFGVNFDDEADLIQVMDAWRDTMMTEIANVWTFVRGTARVQAGVVAEKLYSTAGSVSSAATTPNTAYLLRKKTAIPGRAHRGRMYVPGVVEASVDAVGLVLSTRITSLTNAANSLMTAIAGAPAGGFGVMALLHNSGAIPPTTVDQLVVQQLAATQRRRMRG